jgi:class 3 adenylate cyclase
VFKVDTVGDCYCCVTGVPIPKEDHAIVMADFAREILSAFNVVASTLEVQLGPETADLSMRAGIHSGPGKRDNVDNNIMFTSQPE